MKLENPRSTARRPLALLPFLLLVLLLGGTGYLAYSLFSSPSSPPVEGKRAEEVAPTVPPPSPLSMPEGVGASDLWIRIEKSAFRLDFCRGAEILASFPVALGSVTGDKEKRGDRRTPEGLFQVEQIQNAGWWTHDFGDGKGPVEGAYGPWFIRLKTGWQGIGIHGTHDPGSIGTLVTEGCIRLLNDDIQWLRERTQVGMKVLIGP